MQYKIPDSENICIEQFDHFQLRDGRLIHELLVKSYISHEFVVERLTYVLTEDFLAIDEDEDFLDSVSLLFDDVFKGPCDD